MTELEKIKQAFFDKKAKMRNITIEELLSDYEIEESKFSKQLYYYANHVDVNLLKKFKEENQKRKANKDALDVYRTLKAGNLTFGDVAREKNYTVDQICQLLNRDYLVKGISNYSFEKMQANNITLLRQRDKMKFYFYFLEHNVTFDALAAYYHLEEHDIIFTFDTLMAEELTKQEIDKLFELNKLRNRGLMRMCQWRNLGRIFALTEEERERIDSMIATLKKENSMRKIKGLKWIKDRLSNDSLTKEEANQKNKIGWEHMKETLNSEWLKVLVGPKIMSKLKIRSLISINNLHCFPSDKITKVAYYLTLYASYLNMSGVTLLEFQKKYGINLLDGKEIDQLFGCHFFESISEIVYDAKKIELCINQGMNLYTYYQENFILFRDLAAQIQVEEWEIINYFRSNFAGCELEKILELEKLRKSRLEKNIQKLSKFKTLVGLWKHYRNSDCYEKFKIEENFVQLIEGKFSFHELDVSDSQIEAMLCSTQTILYYLQQKNYDTKRLENLFGVTADTIHNYLYHPLTTQLLDTEAIRYIHNKQQIHKRHICMNKSRNEKGQFVKKYHATPVEP